MAKPIHILLLLEVVLRQRLCCALVSSQISSVGSIDATSPPGKKKKMTGKCSASLVIDVGLPRSGTTTLTDFLRTLGYEAIHYDTNHSDLTLMESFVAGEDSKSSFFRDGLWQEEGVAFADWPYFAIACSLLAAKPVDVDARFILVERELTDWANSLRTIFCTYDACTDSKVPWFYGPGAVLAQKLCKTQKHEMCRSTAENNLRWQDMVPKFQAVATQHYKRVKKCFAAHPDLLLEVRLEDSDRHRAELIHDFLHCSGKVEPMQESPGHAV